MEGDVCIVGIVCGSFHSQYLNLKPYYIDITPVTQGEFALYLKAKALPADRYHYLQNWDWSGATPKPVEHKQPQPSEVALTAAVAFQTASACPLQLIAVSVQASTHLEVAASVDHR